MTAGTRVRRRVHACVRMHEPHVTYNTPRMSECVMSQLLAGLCSSCVLCVHVCVLPCNYIGSIGDECIV